MIRAAWPRISAFPKCYVEDLVSRKMDLLDWIGKAPTLGAEGLELYDGFLPSTSPEYLAGLREALARTGQEVGMLCFSPDFAHPDPAERRRQVERQKEAIDLAASLGAGFCRTLSGQRHPGTPLRYGVQWVVEAIQSCLEHAAERGVVLAMENHYKDGYWRWAEFAQKREVFLDIVGQIDSPWFGVQFDPSNAIVSGDDPIALLEEVKDRVVTVHASDRKLAPGARPEDLRRAEGVQGYSSLLEHGEVGRGLNDYDEVFRILASAGFGGWISIEDGLEGMEQMARSVAFLKEKRAMHFAKP